MTDRAQDTEAIRAALAYAGDDIPNAGVRDEAELALVRLVARLEASEQAYAAIYRMGDAHDRAVIAELCDAYLDGSGAMLGRVRALAAAAPGETTLPEQAYYANDEGRFPEAEAAGLSRPAPADLVGETAEPQ